MAARRSPARLCTPLRVAARKTRNWRFFSGVAPGSRRLRPWESMSDQLQCLPLPLMPANGFSCRSSARLCRRAMRPMVSITSWLWSEATLASSKMGAVSYWLGATSLWRVLTGTPSLYSSVSVSCMQARMRSLMLPK
jgi:hypothetical protein